MDVFREHSSQSLQSLGSPQSPPGHSPYSSYPPQPPPHAQQHPYQQHQHSSYDDYRNRSVADFSRPLRPPQQPYSYGEDTAHSPSWGPSHISRYSQQSFETPIPSRSASPTLVSGRATPMSNLPRPKTNMDSWPNTPMVRDFFKLLPLAAGPLVYSGRRLGFASLRPLKMHRKRLILRHSTKAMSAWLPSCRRPLRHFWLKIGSRRAILPVSTTVMTAKFGRVGRDYSSVSSPSSPSLIPRCTCYTLPTVSTVSSTPSASAEWSLLRLGCSLASKSLSPFLL